MKDIANPVDINSMIKSLIEGVPAGVIMYQADENRSIKFFNENVASLFGCSSDEEFENMSQNRLNNILEQSDIDTLELFIDNRKGHAEHVLVQIKTACQEEKSLEIYGSFTENSEYGKIYIIFMTEAAARAKQRLFSVSEMGDYSVLADLWGEGLDKAIAEGQFVIYYQPQYNQRLNYLYGAEALVRWNHPEKGIVQPNMFIPFLESTGRIRKLDEYVLRKVCEHQRRWMDRGEKCVPVSINLSNKDLQSEDICEQVEKILKEAHLPKDCINFEMKESTYINEPFIMSKTIQKFHELGFKVEMDDFGRGNSSLHSLKDIDVDILKLDLKFIGGTEITERSGEIIAAVVRMAHSFGMSVIAEGVETKEQAEFLNSVGCHYAQGYYFDKPMSSEEFEQRLLNYNLDFIREVPPKNKNKLHRNYYSMTGEIALFMDDNLGASAIIEYDGTNLEIVRMNNTFVEMFGGLKDKFNQKRFQWKKGFAPGYTEVYTQALERAIKSKSASECETLNCTMNTDDRFFWTHTRIKYLAELDGVYSLYIHVENIDKYRNTMLINTQLYYELDCIQQSGFFGSISISEALMEVVEVNDIAAKMLGYTVEEFKERVKGNIYALVHKDDVESLRKMLQEKIHFEPFIFSTKVQLLCKNGTYKSVQLIGSMKKMFGGVRLAKVMFIDTAESFLEMKPEDKSLKEQMENTVSDIELISEAVKGAFIQYGPDMSSIFYASAEFCEMLGYTKEEFDAMPFKDYEELVYPEDRSKILDKIKADLDEYGYYKDCEYRLITKKGDTKWVYAKNHNVTLSDGKKVVFISYKDISAEKNLEEEFSYLRELGSIMDKNAYNGSVVYQIDGKRWTAHYISSAYLKMTGYTQEQMREMMKKDILALIHPDDREKIRQAARKHAKPGDSYELQYRLLNANGDYTWLTAFANGFEVEGKKYLYQFNINITDAKRLEDVLQEENKQLDTIVNTIPGGVVLFEMLQNRKAKILYESKGVDGKLPYKLKEDSEEVEIGLPNVYKEDELLLKNAMVRCADTREDMHLSIRLMHQDGHIIWHDISGHIVGEKKGNPLLLVVYRDISSETDTFLNSMTESTLGIVVSEIGSKEVIYHNAVMSNYSKEVFQLSYNELCQKLIYDYLSEENNHEESVTYEYKFEDYYFKVQVMHKTWYGRDCYVCYLSNIDVITLLNRSLHLALCEQNPDKSIEKMMEFWGKALESERVYIFELKEEKYYNTYEWCAENVDSVKANVQGIPKETLSKWHPEFEKSGYAFVKNIDDVKDNNLVLYDTIQSMKLKSLIVCPIYHEGSVLGFYGLDNPPMEKMEKISVVLPIIGNILETLIIRRVLVEASHAKTDFLSQMSHDIRTPLNGIVGMTHIIEGHCGEKEKVKDYVAKIKVLSLQLQSLINDVLDMSRIESGKVELAHEAFELKDILQSMTPGMMVMAEEKGVRLTGSYFQTEHPVIVGSPVHIQRIMSNLISNAIKYNRYGGKAECWLNETVIDETHSDYKFVIKDTGIGMSEEFLKSIYEPFAREERYDDTKYSGTGLGMAITKKLVDLMHGTIEIESQLEKGTTITVHLPLERLEQMPESEKVDENITLSGKRILLVEDNKVNIHVAAYMLKEENAIVAVAKDGKQAIDIFCASKVNTYDMILMDVMMPVMNGLEATRRIRELDREDAKTVPIIAMTANAFQDDVRKCKEAGMNDHIAKPLDIDVMMSKIAKYLKK